MLTRESIFNNQSVIFGWLGSTLFSGANLIDSLVNQVHVLTLIGWIITSGFAIVASIYKIQNTTAETRKLNAIAEKIERDVEEEYENIIIKEEQHKDCELEECMYRKFYDNFSPVLLSKFGSN